MVLHAYDWVFLTSDGHSFIHYFCKNNEADSCLQWEIDVSIMKDVFLENWLPGDPYVGDIMCGDDCLCTLVVLTCNECP